MSKHKVRSGPPTNALTPPHPRPITLRGSLAHLHNSRATGVPKRPPLAVRDGLQRTTAALLRTRCPPHPKALRHTHLNAKLAHAHDRARALALLAALLGLALVAGHNGNTCERVGPARRGRRGGSQQGVQQWRVREQTWHGQRGHIGCTYMVARGGQTVRARRWVGGGWALWQAQQQSGQQPQAQGSTAAAGKHSTCTG